MVCLLSPAIGESFEGHLRSIFVPKAEKWCLSICQNHAQTFGLSLLPGEQTGEIGGSSGPGVGQLFLETGCL